MEKSNIIKIVQYVFQVILGGMLVVAGYLKLQDNSALFESVAYITWIPIGLKSLIVDLLPWVEVIVGSLLVFNLFKMVTVPLTGLIYLTFFIYAIYGLGSGIEGDCGCFGDLDESSLIGSLLGSEIGWRMVIRNGVFLLMSLSLFWKPNSSK
jgi:hypothetical protein